MLFVWRGKVLVGHEYSGHIASAGEVYAWLNTLNLLGLEGMNWCLEDVKRSMEIGTNVLINNQSIYWITELLKR